MSSYVANMLIDFDINILINNAMSYFGVKKYMNRFALTRETR